MAALDAESFVKAMDQSGITVRQLAEKLGVSQQYVCDMRAGRRKLKRKADFRKRIAQELNVPIHWIEARESQEPAA